jgi:DNA-binding NarL/FixJ family response regulator
MTGHRVLLVDDHAQFRASASAWLSREGFTVVGAAGSSAEALDQVRRLDPEVVLLDLNLPESEDGLQLARDLAQSSPRSTLIIISSDADAASDPRVVAAPVAGFIATQDLACDAITALLA